MCLASQVPSSRGGAGVDAGRTLPEPSPLSSCSDSVSLLPCPSGSLLLRVPRWGSSPLAEISSLGGKEVEQRERPHSQNTQVWARALGQKRGPHPKVAGLGGRCRGAVLQAGQEAGGVSVRPRLCPRPGSLRSPSLTGPAAASLFWKFPDVMERVTLPRRPPRPRSPIRNPTGRSGREGSLPHELAAAISPPVVGRPARGHGRQSNRRKRDFTCH